MIYEPIFVVSLLCPIVVLIASVNRWRSTPVERRMDRWKIPIAVSVAVLISGYVIVDGQLIPYLVHKACAEIEASIPARFQRLGVYPNLASEGYRSFWFSSAAAGSVALGIGALIAGVKSQRLPTRRVSFGVFAICLPTQVGFCSWYYLVEFPRISPDMAGVGLAAVWVDLLGAAAMVVALASIGAYHLSRDKLGDTTITTNMASEIEQISIYETMPGLVLLSVTGIASVFSTFHELFSLNSLLSSASSWFQVGYLCNPLILLMLAQSVLMFQLAWWRWRRRNDIVPWRLYAVPCRTFAQNWIAIVLAILMGVPTLNAFAFTFWLGPLNLTGM